MGKQKFLKGDFVDILPEFRDPGDDEYQWVVLDDEEKGRVSISATNSTLRIAPVHVVQTDWQLKWSGSFEQSSLIYKWMTCRITLPLGPLAAVR